MEVGMYWEVPGAVVVGTIEEGLPSGAEVVLGA